MTSVPPSVFKKGSDRLQHTSAESRILLVLNHIPLQTALEFQRHALAKLDQVGDRTVVWSFWFNDESAHELVQLFRDQRPPCLKEVPVTFHFPEFWRHRHELSGEGPGKAALDRRQIIRRLGVRQLNV